MCKSRRSFELNNKISFFLVKYFQLHFIYNTGNTIFYQMVIKNMAENIRMFLYKLFNWKYLGNIFHNYLMLEMILLKVFLRKFLYILENIFFQFLRNLSASKIAIYGICEITQHAMISFTNFHIYFNVFLLSRQRICLFNKNHPVHNLCHTCQISISMSFTI